jgi:hypothetical protein
MTQVRGESAKLAKLQVARRASKMRRQTLSALKRKAEAEMNEAEPWDPCERDWVGYFPNGKRKDPLTVSIEAVLDWLNGWEPVETAIRSRTYDVREECARVWKLRGITGVPPLGWRPESSAKILDLLKLVQSAKDEDRTWPQWPNRPQALDEFNRRMREYPTTLGLAYQPSTGTFFESRVSTAGGGGELCVELTPEERAAVVLEDIPEDQLAPGEAFERELSLTHKWVPQGVQGGEIAAAYGIAYIARIGGIDAVCKCDICGVWYYAKKRNQVGCGDTECKRERNKRTPGYAEAQAAKKQRNKDKKELKKLEAEHKRFLRGLRDAKDDLTQEEGVRLDALEVAIAELRRSIEASEKRSANNKVRGRHWGERWPVEGAAHGSIGRVPLRSA